MTEDQALQTVLLVGFLLLVLSALSARRISLGTMVRSLLSWIVIGAILFLILSNRAQLSALFNDLADRTGIASQSVEGETVRIELSPDGHFWARVMLNGVPKRMLIDSGATITALSEETAREIGLESDGGFPVLINTANGTIAARRATIARVAVGPLTTDDLNVVVAPNFGAFDVLGMNFLSRLGSWRVERGTLILEPDAPDDEADAT